ncbi:hypothetical protein Tco_0052048 [Tanacetum coccineum]
MTWSLTEKGMIIDIAETFDNIRKMNMKLNPKKCSFGVEEGKFMRYTVTSEGIRENPKKTKAVADMQSPKTLKEMQRLSGKLAALNRFLSRSAEPALPFFKTLKNIIKENKDDYWWTEDVERAFQEMKRLILELLTLTTQFYATQNYSKVSKYNWENIPFKLEGEAFEPKEMIRHQAPQSNAMYASMDALRSTHQM